MKFLSNPQGFTIDNWHGFFTVEQIQGLTKNKISVSKELTKKIFKIYFEKTINQIILF